MEICFVEVQEFVRQGRRDTHNMTPFVYHMVVKNLDFYNFKKLEKEYDRIRAFEIAYKAALFQLESGEKLITPPPPSTLLEKKESEIPKADPEKVSSTISDIMKLFDQPEEQKQLTEAERLDLEKLNKVRGSV